jgi:hypothetical protein
MGVLSIVAVLANEALDPGPFSKGEPVDRQSGPDVRARTPFSAFPITRRGAGTERLFDEPTSALDPEMVKEVTRDAL